MKIAIFFTYDYSIQTLNDVGIFEREMKIYNEISNLYKVKFKIFTYDTEILQDVNNENLTFIPIYSVINKSKNRFIRFLKSFLIPFKLRSLINDVEILHQHQLLGSWVPIILKFLTKKPLLIRTGYDAFQFAINNNERRLYVYFYKLLTKVSINFADIYTVTSKSDKKFLTSFFNAKNIFIVPNWIEKNTKNNFNRYENRILMVGRLEEQKNYYYALEIFKEILITCPISLDIYGSGKQFQELKIEIKNKQLPINLMGNLPHNELLETYKKYNYFLTTSKFEGNPKTVLEALNNDCIVFASKIENHKELIYDSFNGYLFENKEDFIEKFLKIFRNEEEIKLIRNNIPSTLIENQINIISKKMMFHYRLLSE